MFAGEPLEVCMIVNLSALAKGTGVPPSHAPAQAESDMLNTDGCPAWIAAERWVALPVMLRAALVGSEPHPRAWALPLPVSRRPL
jgi:hypothetical protein